MRSIRAVVVVLTVAAAALRLALVSYQSLWLDELTSMLQAGPDTLRGVIDGVVGDVHPPGWPLVLWALRHVIGQAEWALRLPSLLAGVATVPLLYRLGRRLYGEREGLVAAGLGALLPIAVHYSVEARAYALMLCLGLVTVDLGATWLSTRRVRTAALWWLAAVALAYLHYFGLLMVGLELAVALLWVHKDVRARLVVVGLGLSILLAYAPWVRVMLSHLSRGHSYWAEAPGLIDLGGHLAFVYGAIPVAAVALGAIGIAAAQRSLGRREAWLAAVLLVPLVTLFVFSQLFFSLFVHRYLIGFAPALWLVTARSLVVLRPAWLRTVALVAVFGLSLAFLPWFRPLSNQQFREVVAVVASDDKLGPDTAIVCPAGAYLFDYYFRSGTSGRHIDAEVGSPAGLAALLSQDKPRIWLLDGHYAVGSDVTAALAQKYTLVRRVSLVGTHATLYERATW